MTPVTALSTPICETGRPVPHPGPLTFMFTDMEGSTPVLEKLGDCAAHEVFQAHHGIVRSHLASYEAGELEQCGDGLVLVFADAARALACAISVQKALATYALGAPRHALRVRMGLHTGPILRSGNRFFGKTLVIAARITAEAKGGEILVSNAVVEAAGGRNRIPAGPGRAVSLKGLEGPYRLYSVPWDVPQRTENRLTGWDALVGPLERLCAIGSR